MENEKINPAEALESVAKESSNDCPCMKLFSMMRDSAKQTHLWHFQTDNEAMHKQLQAYYEGIVDLVDEFVETYSGHYGRPSYSDQGNEIENFEGMEQVQSHFKEVFEVVDSIRSHAKVKDKPSLINIVDDIDTFINKTIYLLTFK